MSDAETRLATLLLELECVVAGFLNRYDDPKVQSGADVVCLKLDNIIEREARR